MITHVYIKVYSTIYIVGTMLVGCGYKDELKYR